MPSDKASNMCTLPVILGDPRARYVAIGLFVAEYAIVIALVLTGIVSEWMAIVGLAIPAAVTAMLVFSKPRPNEPPADYPKDAWPLWYSSYAFVHTHTFGLLFLMAIIAEALWQRIMD
jgi:1,4-dihydroxy-2-naphthoate octaprenyltransferase